MNIDLHQRIRTLKAKRRELRREIDILQEIVNEQSAKEHAERIRIRDEEEARNPALKQARLLREECLNRLDEDFYARIKRRPMRGSGGNLGRKDVHA